MTSVLKVINAGRKPPKHQGSDPALKQACCRHANRLTPVALLLSAWAEPNIIGQRYRFRSTVLHEACRKYSYYFHGTNDFTGQLRAAQLLAERGVGVYAKYTDKRMRDERDVTSIGVAASPATPRVK